MPENEKNKPIFRVLCDIDDGEVPMVFDHIRKVVVPLEGAIELLVSPEEAYRLLMLMRIGKGKRNDREADSVQR